ncbi:hypothetical protein [Sandaracinus amylolyticus]|uniref:hypothetical protein n=1 Tax=Sandaracinus amylolyticus TaxID=927083 RepID=UPI001F2F6DA1|nr:hypothetical protein [Sandaracinus amylolyticus]UJR81446.1 Hypothetical protein I5071_35050 [Sandaracinus amylolyticus]
MTLAGTCIDGIVDRGPFRDPERCEGCASCDAATFAARESGKQWVVLVCGHSVFTKPLDQLYCSTCSDTRAAEHRDPARRAEQLDALATECFAAAQRARREIDDELAYAAGGGYPVAPKGWLDEQRDKAARAMELARSAQTRALEARDEARRKAA